VTTVDHRGGQGSGDTVVWRGGRGTASIVGGERGQREWHVERMRRGTPGGGGGWVVGTRRQTSGATTWWEEEDTVDHALPLSRSHDRDPFQLCG
jgi:hypothetical protein